jgi:hypothetical protein
MQEAAIVCSHIASQNYPILQAVRMPRTETADSGWQFLCNSGHEENSEYAKVWSVAEVLRQEPTLSNWIEARFETTLWRSSVNDPWKLWEGK